MTVIVNLLWKKQQTRMTYKTTDFAFVIIRSKLAIGRRLFGFFRCKIVYKATFHSKLSLSCMVVSPPPLPRNSIQDMGQGLHKTYTVLLKKQNVNFSEENGLKIYC